MPIIYDFPIILQIASEFPTYVQVAAKFGRETAPGAIGEWEEQAV